MRADDELPFEALDRYLAGGANADDRRAIDRWMATTSGGQAGLDRLIRLVRSDASAYTNPAIIAERVLAPTTNIQGRTTTQTANVPRFGRAAGTRGWNARAMTGALFATVALVGVVVFKHSTSPLAPANTRAETYATHCGQIAHLTLRDGSRVTLAPNSRLSAIITKGQRHLTLSGEAQFVVAHDVAQHSPFVVQTGAVRTQVLGTTFDVRHYAGDTDVRVVVTDGKVVAGGAARLTVAAGEAARLTDSTAVAVPPDEAASYLTWTQGRLTFTRTPTAEVLRVIGRWYGYQFRLADSTLAAEPISATFDVHTLDETVQSLELLFNVTADVHDSVITLHPGRTTQAGPRRGAERREAPYPFTRKEVGR